MCNFDTFALQEDVELGIPAKIERIVPVSMTAVQAQQYKSLLARHFDGLRRVGSDFKRRAPLVNIFAQLRKTCQHPYLFPEAEPVGEVCVSFLLAQGGFV